MIVKASHVAHAHGLCCHQHSLGFSYFIDHYRCMNCSLRIRELASHRQPFYHFSPAFDGELNGLLIKTSMDSKRDKACKAS